MDAAGCSDILNGAVKTMCSNGRSGSLPGHFEGLWRPLRNRPIGDIRRSDVATRLAEIVKDHGRVSAARGRGSLSAMYGWAMREGLCESNPVTATNDPSAGIKSRERTLADHELRAIWNACRDDDFGRIVKLLALTGCRRSEIGGLRWPEIDMESGALVIPGNRTKSHKPLELTLSAAAPDILRAIAQRPSGYVFGRRGSGFSGWSYPLATLNLRIAETEGKPLAPWALHDLRRTMRSGLGKLGVRPDVAERVIGHSVGSTVQQTHDRHQYRDEIADALRRWAEHIARVTSGGNVVTLRRA